MGYTTDFEGAFSLDKPLQPEHKAYLEAFSRSRRMKRDAAKAEALADPVRIAAGLDIGLQGCNFVGAADHDYGQQRTPDILDYNEPPQGQPGLWCQWVPTEDGTAIEWDGGEKFYNYVEWLKYIIQAYLAPWGYVVNGYVTWAGEDSGDLGRINVVNNKVSTQRGIVAYHDCDQD